MPFRLKKDVVLIKRFVMNEQELELELVEKGLNAPRLNPDKIDAMIKDALYYVFPGTTLTVCCLRLVNGFTVTGESACVDPANFNEEVDRKIAWANARDKIWLLEGYALACELAKQRS